MEILKSKNLVIALLGLIPLSLSAGVFDMRSRAIIDTRHKESKTHIKYNNVPDTSDPDTYYIPTVLELNDPADIEQLKELGCLILRTRENFVITCIPVDSADAVEASGKVLRASATTSQTLNDLSRSFSNIPLLHEAERDNGLKGYTGRGVVTGLCDIGIDPTNFVFGDRIALKVDYNLLHGQRKAYTTHNDIMAAGADTDTESHGTHVANTMAGGIKDNPYYGYAPDATIVATASGLYDASLLCGIEDVIEYAREENMPAVVNLSVGCFTGPHDGTDVVSRYLALLAREIPICFSAGNYAAHNIHYKETFGKDTTPLGTLFEARRWTGFDIKGINDLWSADNREFEVQVAVWDYVEKQYVYRTPWLSGKVDTTITSDDDAAFARCYEDSYLSFYGDIDRGNGRYNMAISVQLNPTEMREHSWSRYYTALRVRGPEGVTVENYADGYRTFFHTSGVPESRRPVTNGSASNFCFADGVFSIGAYNTRSAFTLADGTPKDFGLTIGGIANFSSHETNIHGKSVPMFAAPGNQIISAMNTKYYDATGDDSHVCLVAKGHDGRDYRWYYECGTSMSSPAAAGIIATWLEADPTLSVDQIRDIAMSSLRTEGIPDLGNPGWGGGAIDAKAGLDLILKASLPSVDAELRPSVTARDGKISVSVPGVDNPDFEVFDTAGMKVTSTGLARGVYIVRINIARPVVVKVAMR